LLIVDEDNELVARGQGEDGLVDGELLPGAPGDDIGRADGLTKGIEILGLDIVVAGLGLPGDHHRPIAELPQRRILVGAAPEIHQRQLRASRAERIDENPVDVALVPHGLRGLHNEGMTRLRNHRVRNLAPWLHDHRVWAEAL
jgi:hypothetical protein